ARPQLARLSPAQRGAPMTDVAAPDLERTLEQHRVELTGYCYRMLGSSFEAEDAVQETLVRAWRGFDRFEGRSALRSWLYRIATNVCLDIIQGRQRRALPMDLVSSSSGDSEAGPRLPESKWIQPIPDGRAVQPTEDPAEVTESRETIRVAFIAALQHLPARQRAVLILREVLRWKASAVARRWSRRELRGVGDPRPPGVRRTDQRDRLLRRSRPVLAVRPAGAVGRAGRRTRVVRPEARSRRGGRTARPARCGAESPGPTAAR